MILVIAWVTFACGTVTPRRCHADTSREDALELFEKHVRPTLVEHCIRCHGPEKQRGGLRLDTREGLLRGGESGEAVVAELDKRAA